jgi:hypothetical protein
LIVGSSSALIWTVGKIRPSAERKNKMALDVEKVRAYVTDLLKKNKALTEREVKAAIGKVFKVNPKSVGAAVIRDVRAALGIDRPGAIAFARRMLAQNPALEAKKVIRTVGEKFGIRLGPPDVSRLRPRKKGVAPRRGRPPKAARRGPGRPPKAAAKAAPAKAAAVKAPRAGRPAKAAVRRGGVISVSYQGKGLPEALAAFFRSLAG